MNENKGQQVGRVYPAPSRTDAARWKDEATIARGRAYRAEQRIRRLKERIAKFDAAHTTLSPHPWKGLTIWRDNPSSTRTTVSGGAFRVSEAIAGARPEDLSREGMLAALRAADEWFKKAGVE